MYKIHLFCIRFFVVSALFLSTFFFVPKANAEFTIRPITPDDFLTTMRWLFNADIDGDGYSRAEGDCKDNDADIHPGAPELCDGIDNNCNGMTDEDAPGSIDHYKDADGDGFGSAVYEPVSACSPPWPSYSATNNTDCDDENASINPRASEICDGIDNNCSGVADEGLTTVYYRDADGDTYGDSTSSTEACTRPSGYVMRVGDCNDSNAAVNPSAAEICDRLDNNCNGAIDEGVTTTFYRDSDRDGHGLASVTIAACSLPVGYAYTAGDCNDGNAAIRPGASEFCDGVDNNCNDEIDEGVLTTFYLDADGDTYGVSTSTTEACIRPAGYATRTGDCNDGVATINPGALEVCNAIDDNCNGSADEGLTFNDYTADNDGDGYGNPDDTVRNCAPPGDTYILASASLGDDCDDVHASANPGVTYQALGDIDTDCDGSLDLTLDDAMIYEFGSSPSSNVYPQVTCADIDNDGVKNLVISDPSYRNSDDVRLGAFYILENGGSYFSPGTTNRIDPTSGSVILSYNGPVFFSQIGSSLTTYDINGDGADDLIIGSRGHNNPLSGGDESESGGLYILYGINGDEEEDEELETGHFDLSSEDFNIEGGVLPTNMVFLKGLNGLAVGQNIHIAGDIDGDGIVDLVDTSSAHVRVYVFPLQPNSGGYYEHREEASYYEMQDRLIEIVSTMPTIWGSFSADHVAIGDINDDGLIDMVINNPSHQERYSCLGCDEGKRHILFGGRGLSDYWKDADASTLIDLNNITDPDLDFLAYHGSGRASTLGQNPQLIDMDEDGHVDLIDGSTGYLLPDGTRGLSIISYGDSLVDDFAEFGSSYLDFDLDDQSVSGASCILSRDEIGEGVPFQNIAANFGGDEKNDVILSSINYEGGGRQAFMIKNDRFLAIKGGEAYLEDDIEIEREDGTIETVPVVTNTIRAPGVSFGTTFEHCQIDGVGGQELISLTSNKIIIFRGQPE